ncbi:hypothetical protein F5B18DRAFT_410218 [Nemania serpens]|nr:hypothetical protein F5B18DRAFT_410218 [Nemania serpens]
MIRAIMSVECGMIPAIRGAVHPSPAIKWEDWNVTVSSDADPFPADLAVRRVSINGFSCGGTNAYTVVENARNLPRRASPYRCRAPRPQPNVSLHQFLASAIYMTSHKGRENSASLIRPTVTVGHSSSEIATGYVCRIDLR